MSYIEKLPRRDFLGHSVNLGAVGLMTCTNTLSKSVKKNDGPWKIGCYTRPWNMYEYRVALDAIAEAGFKYAGLMTSNSKKRYIISISTTIEEAEQIGVEVKKRGLTVASVYGGGRISVAKSVKAGIEDLMKLIDNCAACGSQNLILGGIRSEKLFDAYYKVIAECCDYAAEKKLELSIKPHGGLNATGAQCRKTVEIVGHKNFRIWYDPGNVYYYSDGKLDPVDDAATVDGLVTGMCVKDYWRPKGTKDVDITPGTGQVNFPALLARLRQGGFTSGSLVVECIKLGDKKQTLAEAKKARRFLEELTG